MQARLWPPRVAPDAIAAVRALNSYVDQSGLEPGLLDLVKIRASQINGCAFCIHKHTRDARGRGESEERLYLLDAWRESPLYSARERAALAWTEALTRIVETHAPDEDYAQARGQFDEEELVNLTLAIGTINALNRLAIGFRYTHPGSAPKAA
jgi:AhpD family alkylhydroperoxidase